MDTDSKLKHGLSEGALSAALALSLTTSCFPASFAFADDASDDLPDTSTEQPCLPSGDEPCSGDDIPSSEQMSADDALVVGLPASGEEDADLSASVEASENSLLADCDSTMSESSNADKLEVSSLKVEAESASITAESEGTSPAGAAVARAAKKFEYEDEYGTWSCQVTGTEVGIIGYTNTHDKQFESLRIPAEVTDVAGDNASYTVKLVNNRVSIPNATKIVIPKLTSSNFVLGLCETTEEVEVESGATLKGGNFPALKKLVLNDNSALSGSMSKSTQLSHVSFGDGVTLCTSAFSGCKEITAVENVPDLPTNAFLNCTNLVSVKFSPAAKSIGMYAFKGCENLPTIDFNEGMSLGNNCFEGCMALKSIDLGKITAMGHGVLRDSGIEEVAIPSSVTFTSGGNSPLGACKNLRKVVLEGPGHNLLLYDCPNIEQVVIKGSMESLDPEVFRGFHEDGSFSGFVVENPNFLFRDGVLQGKTSGEIYYPYERTPEVPTRITEISHDESGVVNNFTIGPTISYISEAAFKVHHIAGYVGFLKVESITVEDGNNSFCLDAQGILYNKDKTRLIKVPCGLTNVVIPDTVKSIGRYAFSGCNGITSLELPEGLTSIEDEAFAGCTNLASINLPSTLLTIGNGAFEGTVLSGLKLSESVWTQSVESDFVADGGVPSVNTLFFGWNTSPYSITNNVGNKTLVNLDLSSYGASFLPHYAFAGLLGLEEVLIPANVVSLGYGTFYHCPNLKDAYFYSASGARLLFGGAGDGNSGSGNANESYSVTNPGSFSDWDDNAQSDAVGAGSKFVDVKSLNVHGVAYSQNPLIANCASRGWTFKPIVLLQDAKGLFGSYTATYGPGVQNYNEIQIADIVPGGTPVVKAVFGDYDKARVLNFDSACAIEFTDAAGNPVSSFDAPGTYLARITGDGKGVIGARSVAFRVIDPNAATSPQPQQPTQTVQPSKPAQPEVKTVTNTVTNTITRYITSPAPAAVAPAAPAAVVEEAVEEAPAQTGETSIPMTSGSSALAQSRVADAATPLATSGLDPAMQTGMNPWLAALAGSLGTLLAGGVAWLGVHLFRRNAAQQAVTASGAAAGGKRKEDEE